MKNSENKKTKITPKQVVAMSGVIILILMYVVTFILALADPSASGKYFMLSLSCTLVIPIIIFIYSWMYARLTGKKTMGDPEEEPSETE